MTAVREILPYLLLLACPLAMAFVMRRPGGHGNHQARRADRGPHGDVTDAAEQRTR